MQAYIEKEEQFEHERQVHFEIINPEGDIINIFFFFFNKKYILEEVDSLEETQEVLTQTTLEKYVLLFKRNENIRYLIMIF
jgi:hypothetical protein